MAKKAQVTNVAFGRAQAFPMYGGLGMSTPSLHRELTDSLIHNMRRSQQTTYYVYMDTAD